jgi:hypothetical protein
LPRPTKNASSAFLLSDWKALERAQREVVLADAAVGVAHGRTGFGRQGRAVHEKFPRGRFVRRAFELVVDLGEPGEIHVLAGEAFRDGLGGFERILPAAAAEGFAALHEQAVDARRISLALGRGGSGSPAGVRGRGCGRHGRDVGRRVGGVRHGSASQKT